MNLINEHFIKIKNIDVQYYKDKIVVSNDTDSNGFLVLKKLYKHNGKDRKLIFSGNVILGDAPTIKIINRKKVPMFTFEFNTSNVISTDIIKYYIVAIYVPERSKFEITRLEYDENVEELRNELINHLKNDTLVITPGYPSESNKYNTAFVHTKVKEYNNCNMPVDVLVINSLPGISKYIFEGISVIRADFYYLREALSKKKYKRIIVHFFDCNYGNVFDSVDLTGTNLYFYVHGADMLYRDYSKYASHYFEPPIEAQWEKEALFKKDYFIKKYNELPNVKWIFVSDFVKNRAEELFNIQFNNYDVIPCYIDQKLFSFSEKKPELQKKVFILRKFSNDSCYALDIDVRAILELSRRECFNSMEFDIYGSGEMFDVITAPLKGFDNVKLHRTFLTHKEIKQIHETHGIALFASRFDTQGVSLCEAASSGCAVVTSNIPVISSYVDEGLNVTCEVECFTQYADVMEKLATDYEYFKRVSECVSKSVSEKFGYEQTVGKELKMFAEDSVPVFKIKPATEKPVLTIIVPSYNVEKYLWNGVISLINHPNAHKLEVLIVNDGSKDRTEEIGRQLEELTKNEGRNIVRLISKENGGHGSTINVGIQEATGKYTKIVDGDDTLDSTQLCALIDILEKEDTDIVLNNYMEDYAIISSLNIKEVYSFMVPGIQYKFEDLCYEGYGFDEWGPILACSSYNTEFLKKADFKLSEKCFYVDVELNTFISLACRTVTYYPLNIYRYLLGRNGQSISKESYMKNYKNHEHVTINIIKSMYEKENEITAARKNYIVNKLILKMIKTQYIVCIEFYNKPGPFREFEKLIRQYPELYNDPTIATNGVKFHRRTAGYFIALNTLLIKVKNFIRKIVRR